MLKWQKVLLSTLLLITLLIFGGYACLKYYLANNESVAISFNLKSLTFKQLTLEDVYIKTADNALDVKLNRLELNWSYPHFLKPKISLLHINSGAAKINRFSASNTNDTTKMAKSEKSLPTNWQLPRYLPTNIKLESLQLTLPCGTDFCDYELSLKAAASDKQLHFSLKGNDAGDKSDIARVHLSGHYAIEDNLPLIKLMLNVDDSIHVSMDHQFSAQEQLFAEGELAIKATPPSSWLIKTLKQYEVPLTEETIAQLNSSIDINSHWVFNLPHEANLADLSQQSSGSLQLSANLPSPLVIPSVGKLQGTFNAQLGLDQGEIIHYQLNSNLTLLHPQLPASFDKYNLSAQSLQLILKSDGESKPQFTALPVNIELKSQGDSALHFKSALILNTTPPLSAQLQQAELKLKQKELPIADNLNAKNVELQALFNAYWLADTWQIDMQSLNTKASSLMLYGAQTSQVTFKAKSSQLRANQDFSQVVIRANAELSANNVKHPKLHPLNWQLTSLLQGPLTNLSIKGSVTNSVNLKAPFELNIENSALDGAFSVEDMFFLAGNPLSSTFKSWPELLDLEAGKASLEGDMTFKDDFSINAKLNLFDVSGVYNSTLIKGVNSALNVNLKQNQLDISLNNANVNEIIHGFSLGPLNVTGNYSAVIDKLNQGKLHIEHAKLHALGGDVTITPQTINFAEQTKQVEVQINRINIHELLIQHPTSGVSAQGLISGLLPFSFNQQGFAITKGSLAALAPGGKIQYRAANKAGLAQANQSMKIVFDALDDFHYSVLSSNVTYDHNGKLFLALAIEGQNPALENGRAINLNINLEEDIPALITSMQLSSNLSDKVKERVQQRVQTLRANRHEGVQ